MEKKKRKDQGHACGCLWMVKIYEHLQVYLSEWQTNKQTYNHMPTNASEFLIYIQNRSHMILCMYIRLVTHS